MLPALALFAGSVAPASARVLVPTVFEAGHFYAVPESPNGTTLRLMVDTGGAGGSGLLVLSAEAARRFGVRSETCHAFGEPMDVARSIAFRPTRALPLAGPFAPCHAVAIISSRFSGDGTLGAGYLPGFIWTFDYPRHALWVEDAGWVHPADAMAIPLHFPHRADGEKGSGLPRMTVSVDGQPLDFLFDTGASAFPTEAGEAASRTPTVRGLGVTSYIVTSVFETWHRRHPDWRVVRNGDSFGKGERLIEVPRVVLSPVPGGHVGQEASVADHVWFTERPDANFDASGLSQYMDGLVSGSLGANVYGTFVVTVDYPKETLWLSRR